MAEVREDPRAGEGFHEETPQEFADQPDREFTKVRSPSGDEPPGGAGQPSGADDTADEDRAATGEK
jgi:hypothetical protein